MTACGDTAAVLEDLCGPFGAGRVVARTSSGGGNGVITGCVPDFAALLGGDSARDRGAAVLRLHVMVDAANVSQDHVCFLFPAHTKSRKRGTDITVVDSYIGHHDVRARVVPGALLTAQLQDVLAAAVEPAGCSGVTRRNARFNAAWRTVWCLHDAAKTLDFVNVQTVEVHLSIA
jgi:hypothetical protein